MVQFDFRHFMRRRRHVIGEIGGEDAAIVVIDDFFQERVADALRDAAMHLAVGDHRIDDLASVFRHQEFFDADAAGFDIEVDNRDMAGIGIVKPNEGMSRLK